MHQQQYHSILRLLGLVSLLASCQVNHEKTLFKLIPASDSGLDFNNSLVMTDSFNILDYMYFFNGGGIAIGDINNDDLPDVFFTGNLVSDRLFLNLGDLNFKDISNHSRTKSDGWSSGAVMVDINLDGFLDIYVCKTGYPESGQRKNKLFINQGDLTFSEEADKFGVADSSYSTQAAFFDYDLDGDLDLYLLNHAHQFRGTNIPLPKKISGEARNTDKLLENMQNEVGEIQFVDVSHKAGITIEGFGLGLAIADINNDRYPDIYISNDFISNDILYINNQDGTFTNKIASLFSHQSYNGMGNDIADINNDGLPEIFVADMLPYTFERRQLMAMNSNEDLFRVALEMGYEPQYTRNTLQLNNGFGREEQLPFSEIGVMAGVHATDWSWSPLLYDFDHDGWKDLFITNGYFRDITDLDFIRYKNQQSIFTSEDKIDSIYLRLVDDMPSVKLPNAMFRNDGDLSFSLVNNSWGTDQPSLSNGAAVADLDLDGDLDILVNNLNADAFLFQNQLSDSEKHFLQISLLGANSNPDAVGALVTLHTSEGIQYIEHQLSRGYQSAVSDKIHFGFKKGTTLDSLVVRWADGACSKLVEPEANLHLHIREHEATRRDSCLEKVSTVNTIFKDITTETNLTFKHTENEFYDFKSFPSLPFLYSREGPAAATGDLNGDGLDDLFYGGATGHPATICYQQKNGTFLCEPFDQDSMFEDVDAKIFDYDLDGDNDLYVVSGGIEFSAGHPYYQDRIYAYDNGQFLVDVDALPRNHLVGSCVRSADFDQDGDLDLFVGGRINPSQYPRGSMSLLLRNNSGTFENVATVLAPGLENIGMVTDATWCDYNGDSTPDLIVVGEWMPITFFKNLNGTLIQDSIHLRRPLHTHGWWQSIENTDFDQDGDVDFVIGNIGLNCLISFDQRHPATIYFDETVSSGRNEAVLTYFQMPTQGVSTNYPLATRDEIIDLFPALEKKFTSYGSYATSHLRQMIPQTFSQSLKSFMSESVYLENINGLTFDLHPLPRFAQISTIKDIAVADFNSDSFPDIFLVGNFFEARMEIGRLDASLGTLLMGSPNGFVPEDQTRLGMVADGNIRHLKSLEIRKNPTYIIFRNNGRPTVFQQTGQVPQIHPN